MHKARLRTADSRALAEICACKTCAGTILVESTAILAAILRMGTYVGIRTPDSRSASHRLQNVAKHIGLAFHPFEVGIFLPVVVIDGVRFEELCILDE